jgi:AraC-like DNA-binding protein
MELGADDYLIKPSTAEELLGAIAARLEKQAALRQWFAAESQIVLESPVVDTVKSAAPKSIFPSVPHLSKVFHFIEANYHQPITLYDVAEAVGYSPAYLTNLVGSQTGQTVHRWIVERRMTAACSLLLKADQSVEQIAAAVGYLNSSHFFRQFRQFHGMTPKAWKNKHLSFGYNHAAIKPASTSRSASIPLIFSTDQPTG